ncbi:hypothetical protein [Streptomyces sp. NBC_01264]|nr:hypothetical protein [Streptomyces sp. NBC_01264]MCX4775937.1 hypothetical protein [Streptomyces sp. NBC_01264]
MTTPLRLIGRMDPPPPPLCGVTVMLKVRLVLFAGTALSVAVTVKE